MDLFLRRVLTFSCWTLILFNTANCLTCGQTECSEGETCCSKDRDKGEPQNCCCKISGTSFSQHCYSGTSVSFPLWAIVLIVVGVVSIIVAVVFILFRRRQRQAQAAQSFQRM